MFNGFHVSTIAVSLMLALNIAGCAHNSNKASDAPAVEATDKNTAVGTTETPISIKDLETRCKSGDPAACYEVGLAHLKVEGTQSLQKAAQFFNWGCEGLSMASCNELGMLQIRNEGSNSVDGYARITLSCEGGYGKACANLGYIYNTGYGVDVDLTKGLDYYVKGCELEQGPACLEAGLAYLSGLPESVDPDSNAVRGLALLSSGCDAGNSEACLAAGLYIARGDGDSLANLVTALPWYEKACGGESSDSSACSGLGESFVAPKTINSVAPKYSVPMKQGNWRDTQLDYIFHVGADGELKYVHGVLKKPNYDYLVKKAATEWSFDPATIDGTPIDWIYMQTFTFRHGGSDGIGFPSSISTTGGSTSTPSKSVHTTRPGLR